MILALIDGASTCLIQLETHEIWEHHRCFAWKPRGHPLGHYYESPPPHLGTWRTYLSLPTALLHHHSIISASIRRLVEYS